MADYNVENAIAEQEKNAGKVQSAAVEKAKENIAAKKLEEDARQVERRLVDAEKEETKALKELRMQRVREAAQKTYLGSVSTAKTEFEASGDYNAYDKAVEEAREKRDKDITDGARKIYGDEYWRYC